MLAITVEACKNEYSGKPNGNARVILWDVSLKSDGKYRGPVYNVAESKLATDALDYLIEGHRLAEVGCAILTEEGQLEYPDSVSLIEACEAYFGSRNSNIKW